MPLQLSHHSLHIEATPEVVFEVISRPEHIAGWWSDHRGRVEVTVDEAVPDELVVFRWTLGDGRTARTGASRLVTMTLAAEGSGTRLCVHAPVDCPTDIRIP